MYVITSSYLPAGTIGMTNLPLRSVEAPNFVPLRTTLAPGSGLLSLLSNTFPDIFPDDAADKKEEDGANSAKDRRSTFFTILICSSPTHNSGRKPADLMRQVPQPQQSSFGELKVECIIDSRTE